MVKRSSDGADQRRLAALMRHPEVLERVYPEMMNMEELASYLRSTTKTCYAAASKGEIPAFKVGKYWRAKKSVVDAWIRDEMLNQRRQTL